MHCKHEDPPSTNEAQTLFPYIDIPKVTALNCDLKDAQAVIRPYGDRLSDTPVLVSEADEELIITIPFTGMVKLHSVLLRSIGDETSPAEVKLFKNAPQLDFTMAEQAQPTQTFDYPANVGSGVSTSDGTDGIVLFHVNRPKFTSLTSLTLYIPRNHGSELTRLAYIGLRGEFTELRRAPVIAQYEAAANPADHKVDAKLKRKAF